MNNEYISDALSEKSNKVLNNTYDFFVNELKKAELDFWALGIYFLVDNPDGGSVCFKINSDKMKNNMFAKEMEIGIDKIIEEIQGEIKE